MQDFCQAILKLPDGFQTAILDASDIDASFLVFCEDFKRDLEISSSIIPIIAQPLLSALRIPIGLKTPPYHRNHVNNYRAAWHHMEITIT
jgi:hypothetical protein